MPVSQFGAPRGLRGRVAAQVVARLTGDANRWMIECLDIRPGDRVLDVGCGPGLAVAGAAALTDGLVAGVDASETMVRLARRRNRAGVAQGRVELRRADAGDLPYPAGTFTRAGSLNSLQFWPDPDAGLAELSRVLAPGGRVAVILMARRDDPDAGPPAWLDPVAEGLGGAGFGPVRLACRTFGGVAHWGLIAEKKEWRPLDPTADGVRKGAGS